MVTIDQITEKVKERFWTKVQKTDTCWLWIAGRQRGKWPYGKFRIGRHTIGAHVASWVIHFGPISDGLDVCHECDNPLCIRPDHLWLGTQKDNTRDCIVKNRWVTEERIHVFSDPDLRKRMGAHGDRNGSHTHPEKVRRGEQNKQAKLTEYSVRVIRESHAAGLGGYKALGKQFGVSWGTIRGIIKGRIWTHVA